MAKDASIRAFKCPTCGAPLEPEAGTLTMKCPYCGGTVIIPQSLRTPTSSSSSSGPSFGDVFNFGLNGVDLNKIVGNAMRLPDAIQLAQEGRLDEAANIYSQITGMEHADAMKAIQAMANGHAVALTPGRPNTNWQAMQSSYTSTPIAQVSTTPSSTFSGEVFSPSESKKGGGCGCSPMVIVIVVALAIAAVGALAAGGMFFGIGNPLGSFMFANKTLSFGSEGTGQGLFQDARNIGVDGNGDIVVGDYDDGRIQIFDPKGKFLSSFSLGQKVYISAIAVNRDGTIYVVRDQKIFVYDQNGNQTQEIGDDQHDYNDVTIGADGKLYAIANSETIVRFKPDRTIDLEIPDTFSNATGDSELDAHLAVDGLGNMYIVGSFNYAVLKYSPDGKFMNRFGSKGDGTGKFTSPEDIAVDGYGRVYVSDFWGILVFDTNGAYLKTIDINSGVGFGVVFDGDNNLYVVTSQNQVFRYQIQKPQSD